MADSDVASPVRQAPSLNRGALRARWAALGAIVLGVGAAFAYVGGWFTPGKLTGARLVDTFEAVNGQHPGFRRNHSKGVGFRGFFVSNGQGTSLSRASVFQPGRVPVVGRFALAVGKPYAADAAGTVRSLAVQFQLPGGEEWRTGMNDIPVFPVRTPQAFHELLSTSLPLAATGKPDPGRMPAFLQRHPEARTALQRIKSAPKSSGFENGTYNSLNAFLFVNEQGKKTPVRWSLVPNQPLSPAAVPPPPEKDYLFAALEAALARQPLSWRLVVTVGQPGDPTADATLPWPPERDRVEVGTLTLERLESEADSPARDLNFDPLVLPRGIEGSDDPLLSARSAAYSVSFTRREGEPKSPSAVVPHGAP